MGEAKLEENNNFFGKTHSEQSRINMSEVKKGNKHPFFGKTHTEEAC